MDEDGAELTALTDTTSPGYYDASFSPEGGFYLLSYRRPHAPWQRVIRVGDDGAPYAYIRPSSRRSLLRTQISTTF